MIIASIHFTFSPEDADRVESIFRELRDASVKEPGVVEFRLAAVWKSLTFLLYGKSIAIWTPSKRTAPASTFSVW